MSDVWLLGKLRSTKLFQMHSHLLDSYQRLSKVYKISSKRASYCFKLVQSLKFKDSGTLWQSQILSTLPDIVNTVLYGRSFSAVKRLKEYSFTLFRRVFWKRTIFHGVPVLEILELLVPKVHWGQKNMWKKKFFKEKAIWRFLKKLCAAYSFKSASCNHSVTNLATRWRSTTPYSCKTLLVLTWTKVLEVCR